ncbi:hypothetical protein [Mucilaginibacter endophyticus]|uniref:hypothetical protein n=1 Tax=Mucilaginibacter endophyticus TaxID=2675003 RepID=UPI000E0CF253|nr:hypothetical protein [Mucilaginibacter endophyticus]
MSLTDEEFHEAYHPLQVPAHFDAADTQQNQLIFALAELGEATAEQVAAEVKQLQGRDLDEQQQAFIPETLKALLIRGCLMARKKAVPLFTTCTRSPGPTTALLIRTCWHRD